MECFFEREYLLAPAAAPINTKPKEKSRCSVSSGKDSYQGNSWPIFTFWYNRAGGAREQFCRINDVKRAKEIYSGSIHTRGMKSASPNSRGVSHLLRAAVSRIARMREYGTSSSIHVALPPRDILRAGSKERSWRMAPRRLERRTKEERKRGRRGGEREREKMGTP